MDCGRLNNDSPKYVHILISRTCDCYLVYGKSYFSDMIKLRILTWEVVLDYSDGPGVTIGSL